INRPRVIEIFRELEFNSLVGKLDKLGAPATTAAPTPSPAPAPKAKAPKNGQLSMFDIDREELAKGPSSKEKEETPVLAPGEIPPVPAGANYQAVRIKEDLKKLVERLKKTDRFAFDTETTSNDPLRADLVGLSLSPVAGESYYIPVGHI